MQGTNLITDILICILLGIPDCVLKLQDVWNVTYISCVVVYKNMSKLYVHDIALLSISLRVEIWKCICENSMIFLLRRVLLLVLNDNEMLQGFHLKREFIMPVRS